MTMLATDRAAREAAIDRLYDCDPDADTIRVYACMEITPWGLSYQVDDTFYSSDDGYEPLNVWPRFMGADIYLCSCGLDACEHIGAVLLHEAAHADEIPGGDFNRYHVKAFN